MSLIHSCLHFTSSAALYKYRSRADVPPEIIIQQGRLLAHLAQWHSLLRRQFIQTAEKRILVLKAHCISTAIYLSCILNAHETAYDKFDPAFRELVDTIDAMSQQHHPSNSILATPSNRFCLTVSLAQPLFFTAVKCRNSTVRRKAIQLLRLTGREGPWHSQVHASVAERIVELEEEGSSTRKPATSMTCEPSHPEPRHIYEHARIHGCGIETETQTEGHVNSITVHFSRCVDVDQMVNSTSIPWDAPENWNIWSEKIELDQKPG